MRSGAQATLACGACADGGDSALALALVRSRASGDRRVLFFALVLALVAFGDRGLILSTVAAKPTVPKWAGEAHAVRVSASFAWGRSFAKQNQALVIATAAHVAWA